MPRLNPLTPIFDPKAKYAKVELILETGSPSAFLNLPTLTIPVVVPAAVVPIFPATVTLLVSVLAPTVTVTEDDIFDGGSASAQGGDSFDGGSASAQGTDSFDGGSS